MDKYYYLFLSNGKKPCDIVINLQKDGYITFNDGSPVDWTKFDYDGNGGLTAIPEPEPPAPYVPTPEELKQQHNAPILAEISQLEAKQHRAVREHILGDTTAAQRISGINAQITTLRAQLQ